MNAKDEILKQEQFFKRQNENIDKFIDELDLTPMFDLIKEMTGIKDLEFTYNIDKKNRSIKFQSDSIVDNIGIMKLAFQKMVISNFSNSITTNTPSRYDNEEIDYDKDYDVYYWTQVHFSYKHFGGGSNGADFANIWYKDGKWTYQLLSDRYKKEE